MKKESSKERIIYEVRDGNLLLERFVSKAKASAARKEYAKIRPKTKVIAVFGNPPKFEPKTPKKTGTKPKTPTEKPKPKSPSASKPKTPTEKPKPKSPSESATADETLYEIIKKTVDEIAPYKTRVERERYFTNVYNNDGEKLIASCLKEGMVAIAYRIDNRWTYNFVLPNEKSIEQDIRRMFPKFDSESKTMLEKSGTVSGKAIGTFAKIFKSLGITNMPIFRSKYTVISSDHTVAIDIQKDNLSFFGFNPDERDDSSVDMIKLSESVNPEAEYKAVYDNYAMILTSSMGNVEIDSDSRSKNITKLHLQKVEFEEFIVDSAAFKTELNKVSRVLYGKKYTPPYGNTKITLHGDYKGDLMMVAENPTFDYSLNSDVGDGQNENSKGSSFSLSNLKILSNIFSASDKGSRCEIRIGDDVFLIGLCEVCGYSVTVCIAPIIEEEKK